MLWLRYEGVPTFVNRRPGCLAGSEIGQYDHRQWLPVAVGATLPALK
jgi:hypothetical protein